MPAKLKITYPKNTIEIALGSKKKIKLELENTGDSNLLITEINHNNFGKPFIPNFNLLNIKLAPNQKTERYLTIGGSRYTQNEVCSNRIKIYSNDPDNVNVQIELKFKMVATTPIDRVQIPLNTTIIKSVFRTGNGGGNYWVKNGGLFETGGGGQTVFVENGGIAETGDTVYLKEGGVVKSAQIIYYESENDLKYLTNQPRQKYHVPNLVFEHNLFFMPINFMVRRAVYFLFFITTFNINIIHKLTDSDIFGDIDKHDYMMFALTVIATIFAPNIVGLLSKYRRRSGGIRRGYRGR
jgi:hypothetical protein